MTTLMKIVVELKNLREDAIYVAGQAIKLQTVGKTIEIRKRGLNGSKLFQKEL